MTLVIDRKPRPKNPREDGEGSVQVHLDPTANIGTANITTIANVSIGSANIGTAVISGLTATAASIGSANAATLRFIGASSGYVGFIAATSAGSATYTWPIGDGAAGYVLRTDGSGNLSWVAQSGGGGGGGSNAFAWFIS